MCTEKQPYLQGEKIRQEQEWAPFWLYKKGRHLGKNHWELNGVEVYMVHEDNGFRIVPVNKSIWQKIKRIFNV